MIRLLLIFFVIIDLTFVLWTLVDAARKPIKNKALWIITILLCGLLGAAVYYFVGRKDLKGSQGKRSVIVTLVTTFVIVGLLSTYLRGRFVSYAIDGPSMNPNFTNGQRILVDKSSKTPKRGDVIIFRMTSPITGSSRQLAKRVIALEGERVVIHDGTVTVYNSSSPEGFYPDSAYGLSDTTTAGEIDATVPKGSIFVLGDNRSNSLDSRVIGPVATTAIVGKIISKF